MMKGIVFDLDGTLVNSLGMTFRAFNHGITRFGGKEHTPQEIMRYFGPGERAIFGMILGQDKADAAYEAARDFMTTNMHQVPLHEGVENLLQSIREREIPVSIFTGRNFETTQMILEHHNLMHHFVSIIANDHVASPKPSPEGLHLAASKMGLKAEEVLFVGDSPMDMLAAKSAGSNGIAALWDFQAIREELENHEPAHWAETPGDVLRIWASLGKS